MNTPLIFKPRNTANFDCWLFLVAAGRERRERYDETLHLRLFLQTDSGGTACRGDAEASTFLREEAQQQQSEPNFAPVSVHVTEQPDICM